MTKLQDKIQDDLGVLRQLLHREQAFFETESQQVKEFERVSYDSIKKFIFLMRKVYLTHLAVLEQESKGKLIEIIDISEKLSSYPGYINAKQQRAFQCEIMQIKEESNDSIALKIEKYITKYPDEENFIVFSLIPALYSCFWCQEEMNSFIELLLCMKPKIQTSMARILLVHQSFFVFINSLQDEACKIIEKNEPLQSLLDLIKSRIFLFPSCLSELLNHVKDPLLFFTESILKPVLLKPSLYGLLPISEKKTFDYLIPSISQNTESIEKIVNDLKNLGNSIQILPSEEKFVSAIRKNDTFIYLFLQDCMELVGIEGKENEIELPVGGSVFQIPFKYTIKQRTAQKKESIEDDPFELIIRTLIIQLDVSYAGSDIIDTLENALTLHAGESRLKYELKLDDFKKMKESLNAPNDISYYIKLLTTSYEERMKKRTSSLTKTTTSEALDVQNLQGNQELQFLVKKLKMNIFNLWEKTNPFSELTPDKIELYCTDSDAFSEYYVNVVENFKIFSQKNGGSVNIKEYIPILFDRMCYILTLTEYRKYHQDLVEMDEKVHKMIKDNKEALIQKNNNKHINIFALEPCRMTSAIKQLQKAASEDTFLQINNYINEGINILSHLMSFEGLYEIGGDDLIPMTFFLFINANIERPISTINYIGFFEQATSFTDYPVIPETMQYNQITIASLSSQFINYLKEFNLL